MIHKNISKKSYFKVRLSATIFIACAILFVFAGCSWQKEQDSNYPTKSADGKTDMESISSETEITENGSEDDISKDENVIDNSNNNFSENNQSDENSGADISEDIKWYEDSSWVFVDNSWLNIRSGPSTDYPIITEVYYGDALERIAVSRQWSEIILPDGNRGFAYNSYLSLVPLSD